MSDKRLIDLLRDYKAVSIIGMSKNAGKTTVLNKLITECYEEGIRVGITSIGRDGEDVDIVTGTDKPRIYVTKGTLIATAADLLKKSDITKEIMMVTGINTPMGEVVFVRARSDGYVQIGGSSIGSQIVKLLEGFTKLGADKVFIDGAISRKTLSNPIICDCAILCTGASLNKDMHRVVSETVFAAQLLMSPVLDEKSVLELIKKLPEDLGKVIAIEPDGSFFPLNLDEPKLAGGPVSHIYIRGALSERFTERLIMSNIPLRGVSIIVEDGSKLLITERTFERLCRSGARAAVIRPVKLIAITLNPVSAAGFTFDKDAFKAALTGRLDMPVYNVME